MQTMNTDLDLRELAIDRDAMPEPQIYSRRHIVTRYILPYLLIGGFLYLIAWASQDFVFPPKPVTVVPVFSTNAEVRQAGAPLFQAAGWIEPRPTPVRIAALAPGVVESLLVVEDQLIEAGAPVAELIKDDAKLAYERALTDLELSQAELDKAEAAFTAAETRFQQPVHLKAALGEAEASLAKIITQSSNLPFEIRRAETDHVALQKDFEGKLNAKGVVAGVEIDIARSKADSSKTFVEELRDRSESLRREEAALTQRRNALQTQLELLADETQAKNEALAQIRAATARVAQAGVIVAEAKLRLDRMTVRSPIGGRIFQLIADPGARIGGSSGMTQMAGHDGSTVVTLYRPDMLQTRVDVRFEDIPQVHLNQPVKIDNPALSSPLAGKVLFISSEADIQKNTLEVKVAIPNPPSVFKPEMLVDATFLAPQQPMVTSTASQKWKLYVPKHLIHQGDGGSFVWLADQSDGLARRTIVTTGTTGGNGLVEITYGLTASSRIISGGSDGLQDGDRITVTGEDSSLGTNRPIQRDHSPVNTTSQLSKG